MLLLSLHTLPTRCSNLDGYLSTLLRRNALATLRTDGRPWRTVNLWRLLVYNLFNTHTRLLTSALLTHFNLHLRRTQGWFFFHNIHSKVHKTEVGGKKIQHGDSITPVHTPPLRVSQLNF